MKINRFEEIAAWQEARKLVKMVYDVVRKSIEFQKDFRLVNQIQDASVSVMSNCQIFPKVFRGKAIKSLFSFFSSQKVQPPRFKATYTWRSIKAM